MTDGSYNAHAAKDPAGRWLSSSAVANGAVEAGCSISAGHDRFCYICGRDGCVRAPAALAPANG